MVIVNKSNQIQELSVLDRHTSSKHTFYICAKSTLKLDDSLKILNFETLKSKGILDYVNPTVVPEVPATIVEDTEESNEEIENTQEETVNDIEESEDPESTDTEESAEATEEDAPVTEESEGFVCSTCGKEFASERSLTMHINRTHNKE